MWEFFADFFWNDTKGALELIVATCLFAFYFPKRRLFVLRFIFGVFAIYLLYYLSHILVDLMEPFLKEHGLLIHWLNLMMVFFLFLQAVFVWFCFDADFWKGLFIASFGYVTQNFAYNFTRIVAALFPGLTGMAMDATFYAVKAAVYALVWLFVAHMFLRRGIEEPSRYVIIILAGFVIIVCIYLSGNIIDLIEMGGGTPSMTITSRLVLIAFCILFFAFGIGSEQRVRMQAENAALQYMMQESKRQYAVSKDNIELINEKCHDLRHQIYRLSRADGADIQRNLREIGDAVAIYDSAVKTGNDALDIILTEKSLQCARQHICFNCMADGAKLDFISPSDIYSLFSNALENAIEAVIKLPDDGGRYIGISIRAGGDLLYVHIENTCLAGACTFRDGIPVSTKGDSRWHGFGVRSMKRIAESYGGTLKASAKEGVFHLNIVFPQSE